MMWGWGGLQQLIKQIRFMCKQHVFVTDFCFNCLRFFLIIRKQKYYCNIVKANFYHYFRQFMKLNNEKKKTNKPGIIHFRLLFHFFLCQSIWKRNIRQRVSNIIITSPLTPLSDYITPNIRYLFFLVQFLFHNIIIVCV